MAKTNRYDVYPFGDLFADPLYVGTIPKHNVEAYEAHCKINPDGRISYHQRPEFIGRELAAKLKNDRRPIYYMDIIE